MFYKKSSDDVLQELGSSRRGLRPADVKEFHEKYGLNELPLKKRSLVLLFFQQFNDILVYILIGALVLSSATPFLEGEELTIGSFADSIVILAILLLNAVLGFVQEFKADAAIAMLEKLTSPNARVRRNGKEIIIASRELLPGDIVILEAGDKISADGRIIQESHLRINESSLTGESLPIHKQIQRLEGERMLAEQTNMVFSGTLVSSGSAQYVITAIGVQTEIGKIAKMVSETSIPETPLQIRLKNLGKQLGMVVIALCAIVIAIGEIHGRTFIDILLIAVSLAVSAVPEGLPAVVTVCFALGVKRMVQKNALVRRLDSLETLGSITVICSDKTGTITENKMKVVDLWLPDMESKTEEKLLIQIGASCNRAKLPDLGDPTEIGMLEFAREHKVERVEFDEEEVPFTSEEKYMQTRHKKVSYLKGAPEKIILLCDDVDADMVQKQDITLAKKGLRVLACAIKENGITRFVGLIGMEDPPRKTVKSSIKLALDAGIRSIMITGDNIETARSIANEVGIHGDVIHGKDLDALSDEDFSEIVKTTSVYARVSPIHKLKILTALQGNGEIVAMSGDGVNDAPALKGAHVGVAMGNVGTQVAREASSMVLADDNFSTIVVAIKEGRRIYDNIRKFVLFLLRANFDEILLIMTTLSLDMQMPYLPLHILWINLMTDGLPALALGLEEAEPDIMKRKPRPHDESILSGEWNRLIFAAFWAFLVTFILFTYLLDSGMPIEAARSITLTMAICFELLLAHTTRSRLPIWKIGIFSNKWLLWATIIPLSAHIVLLYTPLAALFHLVPLSLQDWLIVVPVAFLGFLAFEIMKLWPQKEV